jgi:hypothetical protein
MAAVGFTDELGLHGVWVWGDGLHGIGVFEFSFGSSCV